MRNSIPLSHLVDLRLFRSSAESVTVIDISHVFEHLSNLLCKVQISSCKADGNLQP